MIPNKLRLGMYIATFALFFSNLPAISQTSSDEPPVVIAGQIPLYPPIARAARVSGIVKMQVTTDGNFVTSIKVESGPPMLVKFTRANVQTWEFVQHKPTSFETTFEYVIEEPAQCSYSNASVKLDLPTHVRIGVKGLMTCDPSTTEEKPRR